MRKSTLWAALCCLLFFNCSKDDPHPDKPQKINFAQPEVGQISRYVLLKGEDYKSRINFNFDYLADTLVAEIIQKDTGGFLVKEYLAPGSVSLNGANNVAFADSTIYYYLKIEHDRLKIKNLHFRITSRLFFGNPIQSEGIDLQDFEDLKVAFNGWKTNLPYTTSVFYAFAENHIQFEEVYDRLNVLIDNRPMQNRSSGFTHVYAKKHGLVRSSQYSWYTSQGFGWDLLP